MENISYKTSTLREARARSIVKTDVEGANRLQEKRSTDKDPFLSAETAALAAVGHTSELIPHCHPVRVENFDVDFSLNEGSVTIEVTVEACEKTGMEMEALTAVSVIALNLVEFLKSFTNETHIEKTEIVSNTGGYSQFEDSNWEPGELTAAVLVVSDRVSEGVKEDQSGQLLVEELEDRKFDVSEYRILPDERGQLRETIENCLYNRIDLVATTGGTGPAPRDVTVEATRDVMDRELPGLAEAMRAYGRDRLPYAMFSRGLVAQKGRGLIINFPGSRGGVRDGVHALFPGLHHFFDIRGEGPEPQALDKETDEIRDNAGE